MASLLERMNVPTGSSLGPIRSKTVPRSNKSSVPYNRHQRIPKGDIDSPWSHDLFEGASLAERLSTKPTAAPKLNLNVMTQKALRDATSPQNQPSQLSIKGASALSQGNVIEVTGLVNGTTAEDVAAIFKRCGEITAAKSISASDEISVRLTFKTPLSASAAVQKFDKQPADGRILSVKIVGATNPGTALGSRIAGVDGLGLVREEGSVDVLMGVDNDSTSKMRSDSLLHADPRAQILLAPPGAKVEEYIQRPISNRDGRGRGGRGGRSRRGRPDARQKDMKMSID